MNLLHQHITIPLPDIGQARLTKSRLTGNWKHVEFHPQGSPTYAVITTDQLAYLIDAARDVADAISFLRSEGAVFQHVGDASE